VSARRKLAFLLLVVAVSGAYSLWRIPHWGARVIEHALGGYFHREVEVEGLAFHAFPFEMEVRGLRVAGVRGDSLPFLEVPRTFVRPSLAPLRGNRLVLSRVQVVGLKLRINAFPDPPEGPGGDDIPSLGGGGGGGGRGLRVSIERVVVSRGEFVLNHERVPLDLDLPRFHGRLASRPEGGVAGSVSFGPGALQFGEAPRLPLGTEIDLVIDRGLLTVLGARIIGEGTNLAYRGRLRLSGRPQGQFNLEGPVDLALLERHIFRSGLGLSGRASWKGLLSVDGSRLRIEGRAQGRNGTFRGMAVPRFSTWLSYDGTSGLVMRDLDVDALGGSAFLAVDVPPTKTARPVHVRGPVQEVDGEGVLRMLFGWGDMGVGTAVSGDVDVRWPKSNNRLVSGRVDADLAERPGSRTPLAGRLEWSAEDGVQSWERAELRTPILRASLSGRVGVDEEAALSIEADTRDVAAADELLTRVRRAVGNPQAYPVGLSGTASFRGVWAGTTSLPVFEGRLRGRDIVYSDILWGDVDWEGALDTGAESLESRSLVARKEGAEVRWTGRTETGWYGVRDAIDGELRLDRWPVEDVARFMEWETEATGVVSGQASARGRRSRPEGEARVTARGGEYFHVAYDEAEIQARWGGRVAEVVSGLVTLGGGQVSFKGSLVEDGIYDASARVEEVDLGALVSAPSPELALAGPLSGDLLLEGTLARPRLQARLESPHLFVGDEGVGRLEVTFAGTGDGRVSLDGRCRSDQLDLTLSGSVGTLPPHEADLHLTARDTGIDPFIRLVKPVPENVALVASGAMTFAGPLLEPARMTAEGTMSELRLTLPEYPIRSQSPVRLELEGGRLRLADFHLSGEGTDLTVQGGVDLLGDGPLSLTARGRADLRALSAVTRRVRGSGDARLSVDVTGTRAAPRLAGSLELEGAGLRVRGFPHGVENLTGTVRFTESAAELDSVEGSLAGGQLTIEGQAAYSGGRLTSYDIRPSGRGLSLRYPEGLRSLVDADLRLFGDADQQWVTGTIDVRQALYSRRYDVASEILGAGRTLTPPTPSSLDEGARLDLQVRAPGTLRVDNNLARLTARADLSLQGTTRAPVVTGRAEIESGQVYFQGRTYVIQRGTLDFVNPRKLDPLFDIEAETQIRSYRVTLHVSGTLERVTPTLTSDPPLSSLQILALLAGQDETEVASLTQAQARASQAQLAAAGAATLAAGSLSESVGLEREAERLFGLNRFSIDPSLLRGAGSTPTARVTVGKRLTPDLNVLYSQDLRGTEERILAIEYTLSDRLSLRLTRTDPGTAKTGVEKGWGFDLRIRQSY
jgi:autotransporter translocation and assembly factor TamB